MLETEQHVQPVKETVSLAGLTMESKRWSMDDPELESQYRFVVEDPLRAMWQFPFQGKVTVGRAVANHIVLEDPLLANYHVAFETDGKNYWFRVLNPEEDHVRIGGQPRKEGWLTGGEEILLGSSRLHFMAPGSASDAPAKPFENTDLHNRPSQDQLDAAAQLSQAPPSASQSGVNAAPDRGPLEPMQPDPEPTEEAPQVHAPQTTPQPKPASGARSPVGKIAALCALLLGLGGVAWGAYEYLKPPTDPKAAKAKKAKGDDGKEPVPRVTIEVSPAGPDLSVLPQRVKSCVDHFAAKRWAQSKAACQAALALMPADDLRRPDIVQKTSRSTTEAQALSSFQKGMKLYMKGNQLHRALIHLVAIPVNSESFKKAKELRRFIIRDIKRELELCRSLLAAQKLSQAQTRLEAWLKMVPSLPYAQKLSLAAEFQQAQSMLSRLKNASAVRPPPPVAVVTPKPAPRVGKKRSRPSPRSGDLFGSARSQPPMPPIRRARPRPRSRSYTRRRRTRRSRVSRRVRKKARDLLAEAKVLRRLDRKESNKILRKILRLLPKKDRLYIIAKEMLDS